MIPYYTLLVGIAIGWLIGHAHGLDQGEPSARQLRGWRRDRNRRRS